MAIYFTLVKVKATYTIENNRNNYYTHLIRLRDIWEICRTSDAMPFLLLYHLPNIVKSDGNIEGKITKCWLTETERIFP